MNFKIIDIIYFIGSIQGIFIAVALQTITNKNKAANETLSKVLYIAAFFLFCRTSFFRLINPLFNKIAFSVNSVLFIFGPLVYLYIRRLTFKESKEYKLPIYHYIPTMVFFTFTLFNFIDISKEFRSNFIIALVFFEILAILLYFYYLFNSYQLIKQYQKKEKNYVSFSQNIVSFLNSLIIVICIAIFLWVINFFDNFFKLNLSPINFNIIRCSVSILVYIVSFYSLKQPDIFRIKLENNKKKTPKKRINDKTLSQLQEALNLLMYKEKIYLNDQLTLKDLAEKLNTNSNNISWLLNSVYNCTFYEYINRFRIKDFISKIENGAHKKHTVLALSMDSGFKSKSTFNKAFKAEMNDTPTNYIKNLHLN